MIRGLIVAEGGMAVEDRSAERLSLDAVAIAAPGDVPPGEDKLKFRLSRRTRLAEQGNRTSFKPTGVGFLIIVIDLPIDLRGIFFAVHAHKNLFDQIALVGIENCLDRLLDDVPV